MADNKTSIIISAEDRTAAAFASAKAGVEKFSAAYASLGTLAGVGVAAALAAGVKHVIDMGDEMNDLSQKVGISVRDLGTWRLAAEQSGTSLESVARGVKGLSQYMVQNSEKLREAGITATDANGALVQLADLFQAMPDGVEKTALAVQLFGKAGMEMIPMLNQGSKGLDEARKKAEEYSKQLEKLAPEADKFNDALREIKLQSEATAVTIAAKLAPGMEGLARWIADARRDSEGLADALKYLAEKSGSELMGGLSWLVREGGTPRSKGYTGQKNALGLPMSEMEIFDAATAAYLAEAPARAAAAAAAKRAQGLLDKGKSGSAGGADSALDRMLRRGQENLAAMVDSEEEMARLAKKRDADEAKRHADRLKYFEELGQARELEAYYATAGEETMREVTDRNNAALLKQKDIAKDLGLTFASAAEDAIVGFKGVREVLQGLALDVARIFVRKNITEPLGNAVASMFQGLNLFGGSSGVQLAAGGVMSGAGISAYSGSVVSRPTLFPFAKGIGLMGEAGAEAILPLKRGSDGKLGVASGGSNVVVNIIEDTTRGGQVQSRKGSNGQNMLDVFVDRVRAAVAGDIASGSGAIPAALAGTYGLNRAAGGY